jgi:hypothetical protein
MKQSFFLATFVLLAAGCTTPAPMRPAVPDALRAGADEALAFDLHARGVQIYECRTKKDDTQATEWAFVAPEAELFDGKGARVGKHYAGPHWEALDGSKVVGSLKARANAPQATAIPWLLLATKSDGPDGLFARVTSIQRINTAGGVAPAAESCTRDALGRVARVDYTADYTMFARK